MRCSPSSPEVSGGSASIAELDGIAFACASVPYMTLIGGSAIGGSMAAFRT